MNAELVGWREDGVVAGRYNDDKQLCHPVILAAAQLSFSPTSARRLACTTPQRAASAQLTGMLTGVQGGHGAAPRAMRLFANTGKESVSHCHRESSPLATSAREQPKKSKKLGGLGNRRETPITETKRLAG